MRGIKKVVLDLPGPLSYCGCKELCSRATVDHLIPKRILKEQLRHDYGYAVSDMHNLFRCCAEKNSEKADKILDLNYTPYPSHGAYQARAALYMKTEYRLKVPADLLQQWKIMALSESPFPFERERNRIIEEEQGTRNPFVDKWPEVVSFRN